MYMCRIGTCTQVFFTFYHLKYLQVFQSSINSKSPDSQQKVALLSISMFGCFFSLGWHPVRNYIQFLFFFFQRPNKKWSKIKSFPKKKRRCVAQITRSLWCFGIFGYPHQLLSLRSFTFVDINFHTNPFSYKSSSQQKLDKKKNPTKKKTAPAQKTKWTNQKISPSLAHQDFIGTCGTGANEASGSGLRSFPEWRGEKCPSWN